MTAIKPPRDDRQIMLGGLGGLFLLDQMIEPAGAVAVRDKLAALEKPDQVFAIRPDLAPNREVPEGIEHAQARLFTSRPLRKDVADLRIGELVNLPVRSDREIPPHPRHASEGELGDDAVRRLEPLVGILRRDPDGQDMMVRVGISPFALKIDRLDPVRLLSVEGADLRNPVERDPHRDFELEPHQIDPGDLFRNRVLHLQT